ncbi:MAG: hypothetical protein Q6373_024190, partial [Candidatus Sigynarchaeota archaeon]
AETMASSMKRLAAMRRWRGAWRGASIGDPGPLRWIAIPGASRAYKAIAPGHAAFAYSLPIAGCIIGDTKGRVVVQTCKLVRGLRRGFCGFSLKISGVIRPATMQR